MAAWDDHASASPSWARLLAGAVYFGAVLGLVLLVLYRVLSPLVSLP